MISALQPGRFVVVGGYVDALLVVSFGTTHEDTLADNIGAVEDALAEAFPQAKVQRAFTSSIIRKRLAARGMEVPDVAQACEKLLAEGYTRLLVMPTHLLPGFEHDKMLGLLEPYRSRFEELKVTRTLLHDHEDYRTVLQAVLQNTGLADDEALVLMGHGSSHYSNIAYSAIAYEAILMGAPQIFIGCVEGYPSLDDCLGQVKKAGYAKAVLTPLMLVAGDHAVNDMAGEDQDSWRNVFQRAGIQVRCLIRGLGELEEVRSLYCEHARQALEAGA